MANVRKYGETFFGRADFLLKAILHHQGGAGDDCARVCCTKIEDFGVRFGEETLFSHVNLHIHCGQLTVIVGPNGGGKSTLLRAILGEVPHTGALHYTDAKGAHTGHPIVGYVPQYLQFDVSAPTTVMDLFMAALSRRPVWLFSSRHLRERVGRGLERVRAARLVDRRLGALSGGELQRVLVALALDPLPDLLLLDEPVSGVDHNGLALFYDILADLRAKEDMAIILVSHDLALAARHADQVVLMNRGILASGTPGEVFRDPQMKATFGMGLDVLLGGESA